MRTPLDSGCARTRADQLLPLPRPPGLCCLFQINLDFSFPLLLYTWLEGAFQGHWLSGLSGLFISVICDFSKLVLWEEGEEMDGELGLKEELLAPLTLP